jgi:succinoglycan biosynthesis protein ExoA
MNTSTDLPPVTIIMPVRNEADFITASLQAVFHQDYPPERLQILVVDGMSDDSTREIILQTVVQYPHVAMKLLDNPGRIVPKALNIALHEATGDIIVRVDGHCEIAPDYVRCCVAHLQNGKAAGVGGPIETISHTPPGQAIALAMSSPFGVGSSAFRTVKNKTLFVDTVAFPAYLRVAIDQAGPFDEELVRNQDDEYNFRLRSLGYHILLAPDVRSRYHSRASLPKLWRQYYQYGYYKVRVMQKHPRQMSRRQFVPPLFVAVVISGAVFAPFSMPVRILWLLVAGLYTTANLTASLFIAHHHGWQHLWRLPLAFATLHLSYGFGFWHGLIAFRQRWQQ